ncbi:MAG: glutathione peroxidase [Reyranellaceae bacterium]
MGAQDFEFRGIDGGRLAMKDYAGKAVLLVNVASACGFTPQYSGLQKLHENYAAKGLVVLGVPCNDFGAQEPGSEKEIKTFCETGFGVTFPMTAKEHVIGGQAHPLYKWIAQELGEGQAPRWNFHKYLISKDGELLGAFPSKVAPQSPELVRAVEEALT